jgi:hypothetical protein
VTQKPPGRPGMQAPSSGVRPVQGRGPGRAGFPTTGKMLPRGSATQGRPDDPNVAAPPTVRPPWYKRKYLVHPKFQMTLIIVNSLVTVVVFGFTALLVVRSHIYLESLVRQTRLPAQNLFSQLLAQQLRSLLVYMGVAVFVGVITMAITALLLSHKMAGPMIRLRNFFTNIAKTGDFPDDLSFRSGDFFQDLPPTVNQAFVALKKKWYR